jgi:hypothetical protein
MTVETCPIEWTTVPRGHGTYDAHQGHVNGLHLFTYWKVEESRTNPEEFWHFDTVVPGYESSQRHVSEQEAVEEAERELSDFVERVTVT